MRALLARVRPMIVCAVTLLPEPDSPTIASTSPGRRSKLTPSTACTTPAFGGEADPQVVDGEQRRGAHSDAFSPSRTRGSR